jgi:hypothetical protein
MAHIVRPVSPTAISPRSRHLCISRRSRQKLRQTPHVPVRHVNEHHGMSRFLTITYGATSRDPRGKHTNSGRTPRAGAQTPSR